MLWTEWVRIIGWLGQIFGLVLAWRFYRRARARQVREIIERGVDPRCTCEQWPDAYCPVEGH